MENGPEHLADGTTGGTPVTEAVGPATDRVRIVGAETAADITSEIPVVTEAVVTDEVAVPAAEETADGPAEPVAAELPHWTEAPTGQVPAVLARDGESDGEAAVEAPTWREDDADWRAAEEGFEPAMLGDEDGALGALDESAEPDEERRPWEFDLDGDTSAPDDADPVTAPVPVVGSGGPTEDAGLAAAVGVAAVSAGQLDDVAEAGDRPTGSARSGRVRRSSLRAGALRAKRPVEEPDTVDADDLPGASVAEVPGAGRRRTDVAALAAADRSADAGDELYDEPVGLRARFARRSADRPLRSSSNHVPEATGGHPPAPSAEPGRERPEAPSSTGLRIGTGVAVGLVALVAFKLGTVTALLLALVVVTCAAGEVFAVLRRAGWRPATLLGLVGTVTLMVGAYTKGIAALPLVMVLIVAFTLFWFLFGVERGSPVAGTAATLLVVGWVGLFGSFAGLLLSPSTFPDRHGIAFLLGAIIATVANDVGALVIGRWVGDHPLSPTVSPNKTWEGLAGGALASILVSTIVVGVISPWSPSNAALLGVVVAVVAPLGDLSESLLKRDLRLKDMGTLLPGHGGVLDRVDALIFVLPATYYLVRALNIG